MAEASLKNALDLSPSDYMAHFHLGLVYYTTSRFSRAKTELETVVRLQPTFMNGHDILGLVLEELGDDNATIQTYHRAIELSERQKLNDGLPYLHLGKFLLLKGRYQESLPLLRKAVLLNPKSAEASFFLGKALSNLGNESEAAEVLVHSIQNDPNYSDAHYLLGRLYRSKDVQTMRRKNCISFKNSRKRS